MEYWTIYWFMLPVCVLIASAAMFSGISGAAMLLPVFLIGFPILGVPTLTTVAASGSRSRSPPPPRPWCWPPP